MKEIHLVVQGKGGVGKSFIASLLAQYRISCGDELVHCFDTDPVNQTFSRYQDLDVRLIHILNQHNNIDARQFDELIEFLLENDGVAIIDNGAATFIPLMSYLAENNVLEMLNEVGAKVYFHVPLQGGQALEDTLQGLVSILNDLPAQTMVWLNHHQGEIIIDNKSFDQLKVYKEHQDKIAGVINLFARNPDTFGKDIKAMTEQHLTFAEVLASDKWTAMPKQRLKTFWRDVSEQLAQQPLFTKD